ncbi:hypothetical protein CIG2463D_1489 [Campylobacter iguaniorum]|uniref:hypothetical protein n=1 Tax=Campylobacter iguaniorum TaxID=1244531 RepID=UPI00073A24E7|nr:hypothetical protein [Campylobacter iguaniorum]ALV25054.1 hypothetical protein CIG2463D_1489 [Campylobacter iguaniorum]
MNELSQIRANIEKRSRMECVKCDKGWYRTKIDMASKEIKELENKLLNLKQKRMELVGELNELGNGICG